MRAYEIFEDPKNANDVRDALSAVMQAMRSMDRGRAQFRNIQEEHGGWLSFDVRYWGEWQMPQGEDEDDGDYDWEELSYASFRKLKDIIAQVRTQFPEVLVDFQTGEKNWIIVQAKSKA